MSFNYLPTSNLQYFLNKLRSKFAERSQIAEEFDSTDSYAVGDYCMYDNTLYKFTSAHTGAWNSSHVSATTIANELKNSGGGGTSGTLLTGTLTAGNTEVTITNSIITANSRIDSYTFDVFIPVENIEVDATNHTVTLTYPVQASNVTIGVLVQ